MDDVSYYDNNELGDSSNCSSVNSAEVYASELKQLLLDEIIARWGALSAKKQFYLFQVACEPEAPVLK